MARFGPKPGSKRPDQWKGPTLACAQCSKPFYVHPSQGGRIYCTQVCYFTANAAIKKTLCACCTTVERVVGQAYCQSCGRIKNADWRQRNRPPASGEARANVQPMTPDEKRAARRTWRQTNKDKVLMWNRLRRHRERAAGAMPTRHDIGWLICKQDARCTYCRLLFAPGVDFELDHKTPVSRGGTNDLENIQLVCPTCNMRKGTRTHLEYLEKLS